MSRSGVMISDGKGGLIHGTTEEILDELTTRIKWDKETYEYRIKNLENKIAELEDPYHKDKEIKRLTKERDEAKENLYRGFPISETESYAIEHWMRKHVNEKHNGNSYAGAIGGRYSYTFQPTSIGTIGIVKCICGEEFTFQDL